MRLNRVLQMTAAIGITVAATIFTISCGEDGADGNQGTDCTVTSSTGSAPFAIVCGGAVVGSLNDGSNGSTGAPGAAGADGKSCGITSAAGGWQVSCAGEVKGTLSGCSVNQSSTNIYDIELSCGATKVNLCNNDSYDTSDYFCKSDGTAALAKGFCGPNKTPYNVETQYCGFENETAFKSKTVKVLAKCTEDTDPAGAGHDQPNWADTLATSDGTWYLEGNKTKEWEGKYCKITRNLAYYNGSNVLTKLSGTGTGADNDTLAAIAAGYYIDIPSVSTPEVCGTAPITPNNGSWKGQYCGYEANNSNSRKMKDNACGSGEFPDTEILGRTYCQMRSKTDKLTRLADTTGGLQYCGVMVLNQDRVDDIAADFPSFKVTDYRGDSRSRLTINALDNKGILAPSNFPGEYCTWAKTDVDSTFKGTGDYEFVLKFSKVTARIGATAACGNGVGPNERMVYLQDLINSKKSSTPGHRPLWRNEYCQFQPPVGGAASVSEPKGGKEAYCVKTASGFVTGATPSRARGGSALWQDTLVSRDTTTLLKMNATSYSKDYCGYENATKYAPATGSNIERKVLNVICNNEGNNDNDKPNNFVVVDTLGYFPNEYCQADKNGSTTLVGLVIPPGSDPSSPDPKEFIESDARKLAGTYCRLDMTALPTTGTRADSIKAITDIYNSSALVTLNKDGWRKEYCGYNTNADFIASKPTKISNNTICDDGGFPNEVYTTDALGFWGNQFCKANGTGSNQLAGFKGDKTSLGGTSTNYYIISDTLLLTYCADTTSLNAKYLKLLNPSAAGNADTLAYNDAFIALFQNSSTAKLNKDVWATSGSGVNIKKGEYCGYADSLASTKGKYSKQTGICGTTSASKGPNQVKGFTGWDYEYCQANDAGSLAVVGGNSAYCFDPSKEFNSKIAIANNRLNENAWQGQFCFADYVRKECYGGNVMADGATSTDPNKCVAP